MLKHFVKGALHGLVIGLLGCAALETGMDRWLPVQAGPSAAAAAATEAATHRHAQKVIPLMIASSAGQ